MATQQLSAEVTFASGGTQDVTDSATWSSSDDSVATVDASGLVTAVATGSCTVSGEYSGVSDSSEITVTDPAESVSVTPDSASVEV